MAVRTLPPSARRPIAAIWFAAFAIVATGLFFMRLSMASHGVILYIVLPSLAAAIAGYIWGGAILDSSRVQTYSESLLHGLLVGATTFLIFAMLYAFELPMLEGPWTLGRVGSLFIFTVMFGVFMGGPLAAFAGMIGGIALFKFGRSVLAENDERSSEAAQ